MNQQDMSLNDMFKLSCKNKLLTIVNAVLTILGGYRMASLIVAPTWWEQWIWETVILISGGYSIVYFAERRMHKQRENYER